MASFGFEGAAEERHAPELVTARCADCRLVFHVRPHSRYGAPARCLPCAGREAARLREIAGKRRTVDLDSLAGFERLKLQPKAAK